MSIPTSGPLDLTRPENQAALRREHLRRQVARSEVGTTGADYLHDPAGWIDTYAPRFALLDYQTRVLVDLVDHHRLAVRSPNGVGKTRAVAAGVWWFALTSEAAGLSWKIPTTASVFRQLRQFLWPEIHKLARLIDWHRLDRAAPRVDVELKKLELELVHGRAWAQAANDPADIEGTHAQRVLYIFDEAKGIDADIWDAAEGAFTGEGNEAGDEAMFLATSTPGPPQGPFYEIHRHAPGTEDWTTRHITLFEAIRAGRVSLSWARQRKRQWGPSSPTWRNRGRGEFSTSASDSVIPLEWVEAAVERWHAWSDRGAAPPPGVRTVGVDVAREGADQSATALRAGPVCTEVATHGTPDTMVLTGIAANLARRNAATPVVDVIGVGSGVVDRLREQGLPVAPFNAAEGTTGTDRSGEVGFTNRRSEAWWQMRERLDPAYNPDVCLPPTPELIGDLTGPKYAPTSSGRIQVEPKDRIRSRLGRSTDVGDAVIMAFYVAPVAPAEEHPPQDFTQTRDWSTSVDDLL